jgi:hypothetical protein
MCITAPVSYRIVSYQRALHPVNIGQHYYHQYIGISTEFVRSVYLIDQTTGWTAWEPWCDSRRGQESFFAEKPT